MCRYTNRHTNTHTQRHTKKTHIHTRMCSHTHTHAHKQASTRTVTQTNTHTHKRVHRGTQMYTYGYLNSSHNCHWKMPRCVINKCIPVKWTPQHRMQQHVLPCDLWHPHMVFTEASGSVWLYRPGDSQHGNVPGIACVLLALCVSVLDFCACCLEVTTPYSAWFYWFEPCPRVQSNERPHAALNVPPTSAGLHIP